MTSSRNSDDTLLVKKLVNCDLPGRKNMISVLLMAFHKYWSI